MVYLQENVKIKMNEQIINELFTLLTQRKKISEKQSYTSYLIKNPEFLAKKIGEETAEFIMACKDNDKNSISSEAADIIYHLQVALLYKGVKWREVLTVLESRRKD